MSTSSSGRPAGAIFEALKAAAAEAGRAPSVYGTRPWRWRATGDRLDLHLDRSRVLDITDPNARLGILSCGAALHHARVSVAARGWCASVTRMPAPTDPDRLAMLHVSGKAPVPAVSPAVRRARTSGLRYTGIRPPAGPSIGPEHLDAITTAVDAEGGSLHILDPDQVLVLAAAAGHARRAEAGDTAWQHELDYWTGDGTPHAVIPSQGIRSPVAGRDTGRPGDPRPGNRHDPSAKFAILYGSDDEPRAWLRAGEALSAAWLTAAEIGVGVLPLSATVEMIGARRAMRVVLAGYGFPYLMLRVALTNR